MSVFPDLRPFEGRSTYSYGKWKIKYDLGIGQPDFGPPRDVVEEVVRAAERGSFRYTPPAGLPELREKVAGFLNEVYGADVKKEEVVITPGAKGALLLAIMVFGFERKLLTMDPSYYSYRMIGEFLGMETRAAELRIEGDRYRPDLESLIDSLDSNTLLVLNSPHNPTGMVLKPGDARAILETAGEKGAHVISDEAYEFFVYEGRHTSILEYEGWRELGAYVGSLSKSLSLTGLRIGYLVMEGRRASLAAKIAASFWTCPPSISQYAALKGLDVVRDFVKGVVREYDSRRKAGLRILRRIKGLRVPVPEGAFYFYPDASEVLEEEGIGVEELVSLLGERGVAVIPGTVFSPRSSTSFRVSFSAPREELEQGLRIIADTIDEIRRGGTKGGTRIRAEEEGERRGPRYRALPEGSEVGILHREGRGGRP